MCSVVIQVLLLAGLLFRIIARVNTFHTLQAV